MHQAPRALHVFLYSILKITLQDYSRFIGEELETLRDPINVPRPKSREVMEAGSRLYGFEQAKVRASHRVPGNP